MKRKVILFFTLVCLIAAVVLIADIKSIRQSEIADDDSLPVITDIPASPETESVKESSPSPEMPEKTIYLTFDDGPFMYTDKLLNILDNYGVKATFFVTDQNHDYVDLIGKAYEHGHAIGVHSACHKYKTIYSSDEAFLNDFRNMQEIIMEQTGQYSDIYRFPGGCSNTVSLKYNKGIVSRMVEFLDEEGYVYFDWNITSEDSEGLDSADAITQTVIEQILELEDNYYIVLQHDIYDCSVDATEQIIKWGLENNYRFDKLDTESPTVHFEVAN